MKLRSTAIAVLVAFTWAGLPRPAFADPPPAVLPPPPPAQAASVPQTTPSPSPVPAPSPEEMRHRRVPVSIDATKPSAVIERRVSVDESDGAYFFLPFHSGSATWEQVCVTPCQVDLDRFSTYRVDTRNGTPSSHSFTLPQGSESLQLKVESGDLLPHRLGMAMTGAGIAAVIVGAALIVGKGIFTDEKKAETAGYITGGGGLLFMAVGIPLSIATGTSVTANGSKIGFTPRGLVF